MALSKITQAERDNLRKKSAQSLPDVPSQHGWTPQQFRNAITKVLLDNSVSFFSYHNRLVDQLIEEYLTKEDEKAYLLNSEYASALEFAQACVDVRPTLKSDKIYFGKIKGDTYTYTAVGILGTDKTVLVFTSNGNIHLIKNGTTLAVETEKAVIQLLNVQNIVIDNDGMINALGGKVVVKAPSTDNEATPKKYVDEAKKANEDYIKEVESKLVKVDNSVTNASLNPVSSKGIYEHTENLKTEQETYTQNVVSAAKSELSKALENATTRENIVKIIGEATTSKSGLMSATDKAALNNLASLLLSGGNNYVDTITEILKIFEQYPEGTNLLNLLNDKVSRTEFDELKEKVESGEGLEPVETTYTNLTPTTTSLGGISKGTTFENKTYSEMFDMLLYPYVGFSLSMSSSPNGGTYKYDASYTISTVTVTISKGSAELKTIEVYHGSTLVGSKLENVVSGANVITLTTPVTITTTSTNKNLKAKVTDSTGATKETNSANFTFVYPYYYGAIASDATLTESVVKALTESVSSKGTKTYTITMNQQKAVIAYPTSYGNLSKILDENSFNVTDTFDKNTLTVNGVSYNVYVLNTPATSIMKYTFSY